MECKLRCVNFRRVSEPRRAFLLAFRVTGITDDLCRSTMGVIVIGLGTPQSARGNIGCSGEHQQQACERRGQSWEHLGAPSTSLGVPETRLGAPRIAVEQSGKNNIVVGNAAGAPGNHSFYLSSNDF